MLTGNDGKISLTKILAVLGYMSFLIGSFVALNVCPERFDYTTFAVLAGGSATVLRSVDKIVNNKDKKA